MTTQESLQKKIKILNDLMWGKALPWSDVERWLTGFADDDNDGHNERTHALYLLSHFSLFNSTVIRALLRALYRDHVQYPILQSIRRRERNTTDLALLNRLYDQQLNQVRFLGMGNPSESGTHLLYYFRQENALHPNLFVHSHDLFDGTPSAPRIAKGIQRIVFLDDFCGSGSQAIRYSKRLLPRLREAKKKLHLSYFPLFATMHGLAKVREHKQFDQVETLCELDDSFKAVSPGSRYFRDCPADIDAAFALKICQHYGGLLDSNNPLGFGGCQLLLGFSHNIPNNSLPIFWHPGSSTLAWSPVFPRHLKGVGW